MAYDAIESTEIVTGKPITEELLTKIQGNDAYFYGTVGSMAALNVPNGSFEIDSVAGTPDNWTLNAYAGGSYGLYTTSPAHGAQSLYFTHPGGASNGGGYADSDYIEVSEYVQIDLDFTLWATAAGAKNMVQVRQYDKDKSELGGSPVTLYTSTANPTSATPYRYGFVPLTTAKYMKVRLIGGYTDTDVAATIYFDNIRVSARPLVKTGDYEYQWMPYAATIESTSYVQTAAFRPGISGVYSVRLGLAYASTLAGGKARIYRNGSAVGTERSAAATSYSFFDEDITIINSTSLIQIYAKGGVSTNAPVAVKAGLRTGNLPGYKAISTGAKSFIDDMTT